MKKIKIIIFPLMFFSFSVLSACSKSPNEFGENEFKIQYLGHSAFVLTDASGKSVGIDFYNRDAFPYAQDVPETIGTFKKGDISKLFISHNHEDHNYVPDGCDAIKGFDENTSEVRDEPKLITIGKFDIGKFSSFHFADHSMENAVFVFNVDGVKVVHLGDAFGTMEDPQLLKQLKDKIGNIDILMMPIGDPFLQKVDFNILQSTMNLMDPKVVIPIHYWKVEDKKEFSEEASKLGYKIENIEKNNIVVSSDMLSKLEGKSIWNITPDEFSK